MSIFIKGMEMPESGEILDILIFPNGEVQKRCSVNGFQLVQEASAVSVPTPHGRLGDVDALNDGISRRIEHLQILEKHDNENGLLAAMHLGTNVCHAELKLSPTVIEAEER